MIVTTRLLGAAILISLFPPTARALDPRRSLSQYSRMVWTQVQNAQPSNLDQFRDGSAQPIVWPPEDKTGTLIYPYEKARQK